jgi:MFS transporter, ACS family, DAL5 transporter family protein
MIDSLIERRLHKDRPSSCQIDESPVKQIICSLTSPHVVLVFSMMFMLGTLYYDLESFLYSIVTPLGFGHTKSQLLILAPSAVGFVGRHFHNGILEATVIEPFFFCCSGLSFRVPI